MWKLIYYGLPAAGIVCLYLLDRPRFSEISRTKALQDLNNIVAQIESRAYVDTDDPNFDLLEKAAKTMQAIIEKLLSIEPSRHDAAGFGTRKGSSKTIRTSLVQYIHEFV